MTRQDGDHVGDRISRGVVGLLDRLFDPTGWAGKLMLLMRIKRA